MWEFIEKQIRPPGIQKKNRRSVFKTIARIGEIVVKDSEKVLYSFFPFLADESELQRHAQTLGIPQFPSDTLADLRERVSTASFFLERQGRRGFVKQILEGLVPGRWRIIELPRDGFRLGFSQLGKGRLGAGFRLRIFIQSMTQEEYDTILQIFTTTLDPDIEIKILEEIP